MNVGIILPNLGHSQLSYLAINQANIYESKTNDSYYLFYENVNFPVKRPITASMNLAEVKEFNGLLISTTIDNTLFNLHSLGKIKKVFYVWDVEWIRRGKNDFLYNIQAFRNPDISLVCRSESHKEIIENYCNKQVDMVVPNFNLKEFTNKYRNEIEK